MFGRNVARGPDAGSGAVLEVVGKPFATIQGEGPYAGTRAVFIRLAHCNLRCTFCDTEFTEGAQHVGVLSLADLVAEAGHASFDTHGLPPLVVITGGEPLRQTLVPLVRLLRARGHDVQIETAGTLAPQLLDVSWVVSPKTKSLHPSWERTFKRVPLRDDVSPNFAWLKYVVRAGEGMAASTQPEGKGGKVALPPRGWPAGRVFVQPCDEQDDDTNRANTSYAAAFAMRHGWRLSLQLHKIAGLP